MRVAIDTNILLQAIAKKSRMRPIWDGYLNEHFNLIATTAILLEYEEKIAEKASGSVSFNVVSLINKAVNTVHI
jgi:predicted nucleic acid-binding protein